ncbi:MAG TPA: acyl-CoA dehydrogenase [Candidatus Marinimicrobia bacterium]|nr:acyl-CoA dehydrogenase [Candidatus Neomarinimicrobiota bacterium]
MENYYTADRKFYLENKDLQEIVRDLENDFQDRNAEALHSYAEACTWYDMVLKNAGDICANFIAPRAAAVDEQGPTYRDGLVSWAPETQENMKVLSEAGYLGGTLPRRYGGLNLPVTVNTIIVEMVSQADASLMNLFGLQDIAMTINKFGDETQKTRVLPKFCTGEVSGSMALTEPDAGSDLQAVSLRAIEKDGQWYLDGVKRFITNGCGEVSLVLARSEEGSKGGRGLSLFLYERYRDKNLIVRRIENKHGIHGSPTCELQFNMAKAELVGRRKFGLIKYVMSLMNGARLAVAAQALGIAQAAFDEAMKYANEREQFGHTVVHFPAVYQMLKKMQAEIETTRMLVYQTAWFVDLEDMYERRSQRGEDVRSELKYANAMAGFLTPLTKFTATEMANRAAYDAVQIHGGCGYMKDFPVERLARDARITNIYEGTTQLQVVAAIGGVINNVLAQEWENLQKFNIKELSAEKERVLGFGEQLQAIVSEVTTVKDRDFHDYVANYLVAIASIAYRNVLFLPVAEQFAGKRELFRFFLNESAVRIDYLIARIRMLKKVYGVSIEELKRAFVKGR